MVKSHKQILKQLAKARLRAQTKFKSETQKASSRRIGQQLRRKREGTGKIDDGMSHLCEVHGYVFPCPVCDGDSDS